MSPKKHTDSQILSSLGTLRDRIKLHTDHSSVGMCCTSFCSNEKCPRAWYMLRKGTTIIVCPEAIAHFFIYLFMCVYVCTYACMYVFFCLSVYLFFVSCVFTLRQGLTKLSRLNWNIYCSSSKPLFCHLSASGSPVARIICLYQEVWPNISLHFYSFLFIHF